MEMLTELVVKEEFQPEFKPYFCMVTPSPLLSSVQSQS